MRKTLDGNSARPRSPFALRARRERIQIWPGFSGARKSHSTRDGLSTSPVLHPVLCRFHKAVSAKDCLQLLGDHAAIIALLFHHEHDTIRISQDQ